MSPIGLFNSVFNIFLNTGRFEISDSVLSLKQLQTGVKKYKNTIRPVCNNIA